MSDCKPMPRIDPDSPREQAAHWFARERLGTLDEAARRQRDAWLAQDVEHRRQYAAMRRIWQMTDGLAPAEMRALLESPPKRGMHRRRLLAGTAVLAVAGLAALPLLRRQTPLWQTQWATAIGERTETRLPDGSLLSLNTGSRVQVRFLADRREVWLEAGEALFSVSPDAARPFLVQAGAAEVAVTGTRFNLRLRAEGGVTLAVEEGHVAFTAGPWWHRNTQNVTAGQLAQYQPGAGLQPLRAVEPASIGAWQRGRLVFGDAPLALVASELGRYLPEPVRIEDAALARQRVAASLALDDPQAALQALADLAPAHLSHDVHGWLLAPHRR